MQALPINQAPDKKELRLGSRTSAGRFDFLFIDADRRLHNALGVKARGNSGQHFGRRACDRMGLRESESHERIACNESAAKITDGFGYAAGQRNSSAKLRWHRLSTTDWPKDERNAQASHERRLTVDRKSTRLNSSHLGISYAVFCL